MPLTGWTMQNVDWTSADTLRGCPIYPMLAQLQVSINEHMKFLSDTGLYWGGGIPTGGIVFEDDLILDEDCLGDGWSWKPNGSGYGMSGGLLYQIEYYTRWLIPRFVQHTYNGGVFDKEAYLDVPSWTEATIKSELGVSELITLWDTGIIELVEGSWHYRRIDVMTAEWVLQQKQILDLLRWGRHRGSLTQYILTALAIYEHDTTGYYSGGDKHIEWHNSHGEGPVYSSVYTRDEIISPWDGATPPPEFNVDRRAVALAEFALATSAACGSYRSWGMFLQTRSWEGGHMYWGGWYGEHDSLYKADYYESMIPRVDPYENLSDLTCSYDIFLNTRAYSVGMPPYTEAVPPDKDYRAPIPGWDDYYTKLKLAAQFGNIAPGASTPAYFPYNHTIPTDPFNFPWQCQEFGFLSYGGTFPVIFDLNSFVILKPSFVLSPGS